uniref:Uncharacterized protein n=1 Tax=Arundo donax TaxID=35708 RepID=A0A0A9AJB2_ARUDO
MQQSISTAHNPLTSDRCIEIECTLAPTAPDDVGQIVADSVPSTTIWRPVPSLQYASTTVQIQVPLSLQPISSNIKGKELANFWGRGSTNSGVLIFFPQKG